MTLAYMMILLQKPQESKNQIAPKTRQVAAAFNDDEEVNIKLCGFYYSFLLSLFTMIY